ncbi:MAG: hypothetical protein ACTS2F_13135 [Thainema sp.]
MKTDYLLQDQAYQRKRHDDGIATRYIGDSNEILQEIMATNFRIQDVKLVPPSHAEDFADVQVIAAKE